MVSLRRVRQIAFTVSAFYVASFATANAQQVFGSIFGTVTDPSGAAVSNAKVTIADTNKGTTSEVTTDAQGTYTKGQLIPDPYTVTIEAAGFQKAVSNAVDVKVDESVRYDVSMKVGEASTTVEVTAAAPLLQADRADVAQTFDTKQIEAIPNLGRNAQSLELLNPGTAKLGWQHASDENPQGSVQMVADGQLFDSMGYELDGTTNQDPILGIIVINPTFDSLAEIKQATQNFDAEFEYAANMATYSTKSGSNTFHADAFEYLQLNTPGFVTFAANPFTNLPAATYRQNQYGGSLGGRIIKDKLFFFADAQLNRESEGGSISDPSNGSSYASVPTAANRLGNLSDYAAAGNPIYDPATGNPDGTGRSVFAGGIIPASRISPQAAALLNYFPLPNAQATPGIDFSNNYVENGNTSIIDNQADTREDYYLNAKNTIFGRYSYFAGYESAPGAFGLLAGGPSFGHYAGSSQARNDSVAIGWTMTASATLVNEFRFGYERYHVFDVPNGYGTTPAATAGIPGLNNDKTYTSGLPAFYINEPTGNTDYLGYALGVNQCNCPLTETESQLQFVDNVTQIHGNHTFKFGADIRYAKNLRVPSDSHRAGELTFNNTETGLVPSTGAKTTTSTGLAAFLLGDVGSFNRYVSSSTNAQEHQPRYFFYGQDSWHPTAKWTINLGLRYEFIPPESVNGAGNGATFDLSNGLMYVFGYGNSVSSHGIQNPNYHDFAPRVGIAYQMNEKTVIRAGYGWTYDLGVFGSNFGHNVTQNPPVLSNQSLTPVNTYQDVFTLASGPAAPVQPTINSNGTFLLPVGVAPKFRPAVTTLPIVYQYNATIQRQVSSRIALTAAYVGNANRHGFLGTSNAFNINTAYPGPVSPIYPYANLPAAGANGVTTLGTTALNYYCDCANDHYDSFQFTAKVNALAGWTLQGNYTYQRQEGEGWDPYNQTYYFLYARSAGYGNSNTLPRNQVTLAQNYDIPIGKGRKYFNSMNRFADAVVGGWNLSGVSTIYSGFPFSPNLNNPYPGAPNTGPTGRPEAGTVITYEDTRAQWFSATTIVDPAPGTFGNYPINTLFGPKFYQQDLSLAKTFRLSERLSFQLKADSNNIFNHTNLGIPSNTNIDQTLAQGAGRITGLAAAAGGYMRRLQFSGTIRF